MAVLAKGSGALVLDAAGTTLRAGFVALVDIDLDALLATDPRLADLAGKVERTPITYWLDWIARHPEYDWRTVFADRLAVEFATNRFRKFTVVV